MSNDAARIGDYRALRELRRDDTGVIFEAVHLVLPRRAALKLTHDRSHAVQMMREACVLEALAHPGVPRVFECGVLPDKRPWVARELIEGTSLADVMNGSSLALSDVVVMIRAVAEILDHAHRRGVVHHRLRESAVVRTPDRAFPYCVRGWASLVVHDSQTSPDPSSDVHALGALAFRALTGTPLSEGAFAQEQAPAAPAELTALIDQMLAGDPRWRPNAAEARERAAWLAQTLELVPQGKPRWTPVHGIDERAVSEPEPMPDFVVRIHS
ncbi:MAG TPA: protein kinase [Kofleriaceae bacterium]